MYQPRSIHLHFEDEPNTFEVIINRPTTVCELAQAEKALCGWGHYAIVLQNGQRVSLDALLHTDILYTISLRKVHK